MALPGVWGYSWVIQEYMVMVVQMVLFIHAHPTPYWLVGESLTLLRRRSTGPDPLILRLLEQSTQIL